jgi:hypothetical protein
MELCLKSDVSEASKDAGMPGLPQMTSAGSQVIAGEFVYALCA